jgi:deazaflavin-dependent oxidoreductase (nitroreductase family)
MDHEPAHAETKAHAGLNRDAAPGVDGQTWTADGNDLCNRSTQPMATRLVDLHPGQGLLRVVFRLPIWLYRIHLGRLLGNRFLLLTHLGRKSGLPRQVVLEVLRHDRTTDTYIIASAWGAKANWFQNIQQTPEVVIHAGRRRLAATATRLSMEAAEREVRTYAQRHPLAFLWGFPLIFGVRPRTDAEFHRFAQFIPIVAVRPKR